MVPTVSDMHMTDPPKLRDACLQLIRMSVGAGITQRSTSSINCVRGAVGILLSKVEVVCRSDGREGWRMETLLFVMEQTNWLRSLFHHQLCGLGQVTQPLCA